MHHGSRVSLCPPGSVLPRLLNKQPFETTSHDAIYHAFDLTGVPVGMDSHMVQAVAYATVGSESFVAGCRCSGYSSILS